MYTRTDFFWWWIYKGIFFYLIVSWISLDFTTCNKVRGPPSLWRASYTGPDSVSQVVTPLKSFVGGPGSLGLRALGLWGGFCFTWSSQVTKHSLFPINFYKKSPTDNISCFYWWFGGYKEGSLRRWPLSYVSLAGAHSLLISPSHHHLQNKQIPPLPPH